VPTDAQILLLVGGLHLIGAVLAGLLIVLCLRTDTVRPWTPGQEGEDEGGGGSDRRVPRAPDRPRGGGLPLPDATPARARLRGPATLATLVGRRERRPTREPLRRPVPARHHQG